ncbi:hypothetical protein HIM_03557 [Hirsutella minnesotensis 3608]|uniref:Fungal lipase-type domain-containing protein n=1 Tax=Hirsutella minnesotensis 3608 TaxID=1043627 RepID=A0A0F7ZMH1_9HYPO|nr:hypothetical protein HIM_03557 [Hirsutella minnesotensis 3608]
MGLFSAKSRHWLRPSAADPFTVHQISSPENALPSLSQHSFPSRLLDDSLLQYPRDDENQSPPEYLAVVDEPAVCPPLSDAIASGMPSPAYHSRATSQSPTSQSQKTLPPLPCASSSLPGPGDATLHGHRRAQPRSRANGHARSDSNSSVNSNSSVDSVSSTFSHSSTSSTSSVDSTCSQASVEGKNGYSLGSLYKDACNRLDDVLTLIDCEKYTEYEAASAHDSSASATHPMPSSPTPLSSSAPNMSWTVATRSLEPRTDRGLQLRKRKPAQKMTGSENGLQLSSAVPGKYFHKVDFYANSKLPMALPPLAVYPATWPLLCLAARCSLKVYSAPSGPERRQEVVVPADRRSGCKAMYIKSVPADAVRTIVVAVRGTASFSDWAINLRSEPVAPTGFLDDPGNACHAGFLSAARAMVRPIARALCQMLEEDPGRATYSVAFTGHSAGGAVASLLYMHMLAAGPEVESELTTLAGCFRRLHCITFGAPPVSLLPLTKPGRPELQSSIFMSFVNEGDPVTRADKAYVKSLFSLMASPPPQSPDSPTAQDNRHKRRSSSAPLPPSPSSPTWRVPSATLSNAGRIVILRGTSRGSAGVQQRSSRDRPRESVSAVTCRDDQLRGVIWGDPACHLMRLYSSRIEALAIASATGRRP